MTTKFIILAILLIASTVEARKLVTSNDRKADIDLFVKGFLKGVSSTEVFDHIKTCIADSETFYSDIANGIADIRTRDPAKVKEGIALIGQAIRIIPEAAKACQASAKDIKKFIAFAQSFTNPASFLYHVGKSLLINRVEVIHEVNSAVAAYQSQDFYNLGYWTGKAVNTIFLGLNNTIRPAYIDHLNAEQSSWVAELPEKFENLTLAQIKSRYLGAIIDYSQYDNITVYNYEGAVGDIPKEFDSMKHWPGCVHPIRDQGHCGSCWAFAASETLSDRFCIASNKTVDHVLSPQYLVSCNNILNHGCNGGVLLFSWWFLVSDGLPTDACLPYVSGDGHNPACKQFTTCHDGSEKKFYKAKKGSIAQFANPTSIQKNIMEHGPVETGFTVYEDFLAYKSGVYKHTSGSVLGGHAVKIIGWGNENGTDYWLVANSWGTTWGMNGFFKIAFGQCGIDKDAIAGEADLSKIKQSRIPKNPKHLFF